MYRAYNGKFKIVVSENRLLTLRQSFIHVAASMQNLLEKLVNSCNSYRNKAENMHFSRCYAESKMIVSPVKHTHARAHTHGAGLIQRIHPSWPPCCGMSPCWIRQTWNLKLYKMQIILRGSNVLRCLINHITINCPNCLPICFSCPEICSSSTISRSTSINHLTIITRTKLKIKNL